MQVQEELRTEMAQLDAEIAWKRNVRDLLAEELRKCEDSLADVATKRAKLTPYDLTSVQQLRCGDRVTFAGRVDAAVTHVGFAGRGSDGVLRYEIGTDQDGASGDEWYPADLEVLVRLPRPDLDELEPF